VFAVILLGRLLKRGRLVADAFWQPAEAITFYIFFPALLVSNTATAKLRGAEIAPMLAALLASILAVAALTFALRRPLRLDGPAFTSLLQGAIRPNSTSASPPRRRCSGAKALRCSVSPSRSPCRWSTSSACSPCSVGSAAHRCRSGCSRWAPAST
jgi:predicted permease